MLATHFFQRVNHWLPALSRFTQRPVEPISTAEQVIVPPGDAYFLTTGAYHVRVLTGQLWLPEHGILTAGAQSALHVDWRGVELQPATTRPVVFTLCPQI